MTTETQPDINIDLPDISVADVQQNAHSYWTDLQSYITDDYGWLPFLIIIIALATGVVIRRVTQPKILPLIDHLSVSFRLKGILRNLTKLIFQMAALVVIAIAQVIVTNLFPDVDARLLSATSKLLTAWIFIRIVAQIIENSFIRQTVALAAWVAAALSILGVMEETKTGLDAIGMDFGDFRLSLFTVIKFVFVLIILLTLTSLLTRSAERSLHKATDLTPSARVLLIKIIKITLISLAILIGITSAGIDLSALAIFGGALGLGIGFGLQKVVSNLFSGMLLLLDKSIKPGDIIELPEGNGTFGWVSQLGARYVSLITRDNKEYLIPNEDFVTQPVINWSYTDRKIRVETKFGVDYKSDPHVIKKLAVEAAQSCHRVCENPSPVCHLVEFGDSSLNFVLRYWIEDAENGVTNTKGDVMLALWDIFKEHGIEIPFPHRVLIQK